MQALSFRLGSTALLYCMPCLPLIEPPLIPPAFALRAILPTTFHTPTIWRQQRTFRIGQQRYVFLNIVPIDVLTPQKPVPKQRLTEIVNEVGSPPKNIDIIRPIEFLQGLRYNFCICQQLRAQPCLILEHQHHRKSPPGSIVLSLSLSVLTFPQNTTLQSLISEISASPQQKSFKFVVTSTIMEQQNPASHPRIVSSNEPTQTLSSDTSTTGGSAGSAAGKRGMHSATGAYWNKQQDGMWSHKYEKQESKGFDVIVTVIWVAMV